MRQAAAADEAGIVLGCHDEVGDSTICAEVARAGQAKAGTRIDVGIPAEHDDRAGEKRRRLLGVFTDHDDVVVGTIAGAKLGDTDHRRAIVEPGAPRRFARSQQALRQTLPLEDKRSLAVSSQYVDVPIGDDAAADAILILSRTHEEEEVWCLCGHDRWSVQKSASRGGR